MKLLPDSANDELHIRRLNALEFRNAGLSVLPLRLDGSKAATVPWKTFQKRLPTQGEITYWFQQDAGAAIVCGIVSGGLEVMDFDHEADTVFPAWAAMVDSILIRLPVVETPSGGFHVMYRCCEVCRNMKIALSLEAKVFIETRGEGGYVATVLSPPEVHARKHEYIQVAGPILPEVPTITPAERTKLWRAAMSFDESDILKKRAERFKPKPVRFLNPIGERERVERARRYISKMEPAISGANGHNQTFKVAKVCLDKFELSQETSLALLQEYNRRCEPLWSDRELDHKIRSAAK